MGMMRTNKKVTARHLRFAVLATDVVILTLKEGELYVRLSAVNRPPYFVNAKGLPGGLISPEETAEQAVLRHIKNKARIDPKKFYIEQLYTFSAINRDPRGRVVAVAYLAFVPWEELSKAEQANSSEAFWQLAQKTPKLAYDHNEILKTALERVRSRVSYTTLIAKLMPKEFPLADLEKAYEGILDKKLDRRNFRKKINKLKLLVSLKKKLKGLKWRPAMLYSFRSKKVENIEIL